MKLLAQYTNGNYDVCLFDNGTKVRLLHEGETEYKPEFPENIDLCISHRCSIGCKYCYANCKPTDRYLDCLGNGTFLNFISTLNPGTELAVGGGALSEISDSLFDYFLGHCNMSNVIVNITVNIKELVARPTFASKIVRYQNDRQIFGVGISYNAAHRDLLLSLKSVIKNMVVHTIVGITTQDDYEWLAKNNFKVLILGYKTKGRGVEYANNCDTAARDWTKENILSLSNDFKTLSFDCLAVEQLDIKNQVSEEVWESNYMGDDGMFTMFVDLVDLKYAKSSTETRLFGFSFDHRTADKMFKYLQTNN